jgi:Clathrin adaptor complex small chain
MTLKYFLLVNKQGQTRLSQYYQYVPLDERTIMEADIVRQCLARAETQVRLLLGLHSARALSLSLSCALSLECVPSKVPVAVLSCRCSVVTLTSWVHSCSPCSIGGKTFCTVVSVRVVALLWWWCYCCCVLYSVPL